jgi:hypothetical protein
MEIVENHGLEQHASQYDLAVHYHEDLFASTELSEIAMDTTIQPHILYIFTGDSEPKFMAANLTYEGSLRMCEYNSFGGRMVVGIASTIETRNNGKKARLVPLQGNAKHSFCYINGNLQHFSADLQERYREVWKTIREC